MSVEIEARLGLHVRRLREIASGLRAAAEQCEDLEGDLVSLARASDALLKVLSKVPARESGAAPLGEAEGDLVRALKALKAKGRRW